MADPEARGPDRPGRPSTRPGPSVRASGLFLALLVIGSGIVIPGAISRLAQLSDPGTANGSLLHRPDGTPYGSAFLGQNLTNPAYFWLRPSLIDDQPFTGAGGESPFGPTDPALLNETRYYIAVYGLNNSTVPLDLVSPSASGLDPDLTPAAALVQIPRVAHFTGLSQSALLGLVNRDTHNPTFGILGPEYVNVLRLDVDLLAMLGQHP